VPGTTARGEEAPHGHDAAHQLPPPVSGTSPVDTQARPGSREPLTKPGFKRFARGLTIVGGGLLALVIGTLAMRQELGYQLRRLVAEYEAKQRELAAEYEAKQRELAAEDEAQRRELVAEEEAKQRELVADYEAKKRELVAEYQAKKDQNDTETRQAKAEYKRKEEELAAEYDRRLEATHGPNESADLQQAASIFGLIRPFVLLSPDDLDETKRLGNKWQGKVDWQSPYEDFGVQGRPGRIEADRYQYFIHSHPVRPAEVVEYLALPMEKRIVICSLSRRRLLTTRDAGASSAQPKHAANRAP
jgi:hypothetical protein